MNIGFSSLILLGFMSGVWVVGVDCRRSPYGCMNEMTDSMVYNIDCMRAPDYWKIKAPQTTTAATTSNPTTVSLSDDYFKYKVANICDDYIKQNGMLTSQVSKLMLENEKLLRSSSQQKEKENTRVYDDGWRNGLSPGIV